MTRMSRKVTSFADSTKLSMEATVLSNATGFHVGRRGMHGPACGYVREIGNLLPAEQMLDTGLVDYALGAAPHTGAFVVVHEDSPLKKVQLAYYKLGDGPFYVFYTPFHLPHIQIASTIGRAVIHRDPTVAPIGGPVCEVVTVAKRDLKAGERLDGIGGFCTYGLIDNTAAARSMAALPIGLSEGCVLRRDVSKDGVLSFDDVEAAPAEGWSEELWREQNARWPRARTGKSRQCSVRLQESFDEGLVIRRWIWHSYLLRRPFRSRPQILSLAGVDQSCLIVRSGRAAVCSSQGIPASREAGSRCGWMPSEPR